MPIAEEILGSSRGERDVFEQAVAGGVMVPTPAQNGVGTFQAQISHKEYVKAFFILFITRMRM